MKITQDIKDEHTKEISKLEDKKTKIEIEGEGDLAEALAQLVKVDIDIAKYTKIYRHKNRDDEIKLNEFGTCYMDIVKSCIGDLSLCAKLKRIYREKKAAVKKLHYCFMKARDEKVKEEIFLTVCAVKSAGITSETMESILDMYLMGREHDELKVLLGEERYQGAKALALLNK